MYQVLNIHMDVSKKVFNIFRSDFSKELLLAQSNSNFQIVNNRTKYWTLHK